MTMQQKKCIRFELVVDFAYFVRIFQGEWLQEASGLWLPLSIGGVPKFELVKYV